ncbi:heme-binding domain-containing protein [Tenacibaculum sp. Mcav3-52]|uniref:heme-binding domain-containing protein n=1 Tax=unclassified Tenacibaculum TaxID=2635139 RepID=UPI0012E67A31|nr:heme-binding domain-containing protein [Tenacibaculum sp. Mcav3-52]MCG7501224.1 heme-binding domain-containing protein [Tenacibaculum sp. Mcav3-52]GFD72707.1 heme-binding protein [Tenacibaculum sp. KUL113]GFD80123.1 heme-binding protein [Tenacibaculum sp. KUL118]
MKLVKIIAIILLVVFVGIQFIPVGLNQSNSIPRTDFMLVNDVPNGIKDKLQVSCYDCHSNNTKYPWYNKIQPIAWFLEDHIEEGKAELNFNEWDSLSNRRKVSKLRSIIKQIESGEMPLDSYTLIHKDAKFSEAEKEEIISWITQLKDSL